MSLAVGPSSPGHSRLHAALPRHPPTSDQSLDDQRQTRHDNPVILSADGKYEAVPPEAELVTLLIESAIRLGPWALKDHLSQPMADKPCYIAATRVCAYLCNNLAGFCTTERKLRALLDIDSRWDNLEDEEEVADELLKYGELGGLVISFTKQIPSAIMSISPNNDFTASGVYPGEQHALQVLLSEYNVSRASVINCTDTGFRHVFGVYSTDDRGTRTLHIGLAADKDLSPASLDRTSHWRDCITRALFPNIHDAHLEPENQPAQCRRPEYIRRIAMK